MIQLLRGLFSSPSALVCPHCEREMEEGHSVDACARKRMSRRFFLGAIGGAAASLVVAPVLPQIIGPGEITLSPELFSRIVLESLRDNLQITREMNKTYWQVILS